jgi:hypothetical protein
MIELHNKDMFGEIDGIEMRIKFELKSYCTDEKKISL